MEELRSESRILDPESMSCTTLLHCFSEMKTRGQEGPPPPQPGGTIHSVRDHKEVSEDGRKGASEFGNRDEHVRELTGRI